MPAHDRAHADPGDAWPRWRSRARSLSPVGHDHIIPHQLFRGKVVDMFERCLPASRQDWYAWPLSPAMSGRPGLYGVGNDVAEVRALARVEDAAAGDEAKLRVGSRAVHGERGEAVLGVHLHGRHPEHRERPVRTPYVHTVTRAQLRQAEEDSRAGPGVEVP